MTDIHEILFNAVHAASQLFDLAKNFHLIDAVEGELKEHSRQLFREQLSIEPDENPEFLFKGYIGRVTTEGHDWRGKPEYKYYKGDNCYFLFTDGLLRVYDAYHDKLDAPPFFRGVSCLGKHERRWKMDAKIFTDDPSIDILQRVHPGRFLFGKPKTEEALIEFLKKKYNLRPIEGKKTRDDRTLYSAVPKMNFRYDDLVGIKTIDGVHTKMDGTFDDGLPYPMSEGPKTIFRDLKRDETFYVDTPGIYFNESLYPRVEELIKTQMDIISAKNIKLLFSAALQTQINKAKMLGTWVQYTNLPQMLGTLSSIISQLGLSVELIECRYCGSSLDPSLLAEHDITYIYCTKCDRYNQVTSYRGAFNETLKIMQAGVKEGIKEASVEAFKKVGIRLG